MERTWADRRHVTQRHPADSNRPQPQLAVLLWRQSLCKHRRPMSQPRLATPPSIPAIDPNDLRVTRLRALRGPNYWRLAPVIACDVRLGALESVTSAMVPGFCDRLLTALPTLSEHPCTRGAPGGFVERLEGGTHIPHILEHVALELQNLAGS